MALMRNPFNTSIWPRLGPGALSEKLWMLSDEKALSVLSLRCYLSQGFSLLVIAVSA